MALNTKDIQFGSGTLYIDGRNVGAVTDASLTYEIEKEQHVSGQPPTVDKVVVSALNLSVKANLKEINPINLRDALDLRDADIITESSGSGEADETIAISTARWTKLSERNVSDVVVKVATKTTAIVSATATAIPVENAFGFSQGDTIKIGGTTKTISSVSGNTINVASAFGFEIAYGTTVINTTDSFTEGTDFLVDPIDGRIVAVAGGGLSGASYVYVTYDYVKLSRVKVPLGVTPRNRVFYVEFVHKRDDGYMRIQMPKGQVSGGLEFAFANEFHAIPITVTGLSVEELGGISGYVIFEYE